MRRLFVKRSAAVLVVAVIVGGAATAALSYWGGNGSGSATTVLANVKSLSLEPGTPTAQLSPGNDAGVATVVSNPNPFFVEIGSLVLETSGGKPFTVDSAHSGCNVSALSFTTQDNGGAGWQVPPRAGAADGTLTIDMPAAMAMGIGAASACQGAIFNVRLEARP